MGAGECAFLMAEQFGFDQVLRQAGAIDVYEWSFTAGAAGVQQTGYHVLACAGFAKYQNGRGDTGAGHVLQTADLLPDSRDRRTLTEKFHTFMGMLFTLAGIGQFPGQFILFQDLLNGNHQFIKVDRFFQVIGRP